MNLRILIRTGGIGYSGGSGILLREWGEEEAGGEGGAGPAGGWAGAAVAIAFEGQALGFSGQLIDHGFSAGDDEGFDGFELAGIVGWARDGQVWRIAAGAAKAEGLDRSAGDGVVEAGEFVFGFVGDGGAD